MSNLNISENIKLIKERLAEAAHLSGRNLDDILLVAVSKTKSIGQILEAYAGGIKVFGENYAQEFCEKRELLNLKEIDIKFHFIGHLQSNKVKLIADKVSCIQTLDSLSLANKINQFISQQGIIPLSVLVQVNVSNEPQKSGVNSEVLIDFLGKLTELTSLKVQGLMTVGSFSEDLSVRRKEFALLRSLRDKAESEGFTLNDLSMGMSDDFELAIAEGATIVRVGSAIFGERN